MIEYKSQQAFLLKPFPFMYNKLFMSSSRKYCLIFLICLLSSSFIHAQEGHLLPYPKNIQFGADKFLLKNAAIELSDKASKEDKFAFRQLQQIIKEKTGIEIQILQSSAKSKLKAIRIGEVGNLPSLPALNETPGSQSREAYHISVKANEIIFKANSSAGIYYGMQTLSQLIHNEGVNSYVKEMEASADVFVFSKTFGFRSGCGCRGARRWR